MMTEFVETAVVGGGQQGCSVAGSLARLGYRAVVFERGEIGQAWAQERWESLRVNTPNRTVTFPGLPYDGDDPEGYMPAREVASRLRRYVAEAGIEVREHTPVRSVEAPVDTPVHPDARFRVHLENGQSVEARNIVAALGGYSSPRLPELTARIDPSITQLHTRYYRDPGPCRPARCSSWARATAASRSPRTCATPAGTCISRSAGTRPRRAATGVPRSWTGSNCCRWRATWSPRPAGEATRRSCRACRCSAARPAAATSASGCWPARASPSSAPSAVCGAVPCSSRTTSARSRATRPAPSPHSSRPSTPR